MTLIGGNRLGPYEILAPLGAGGMGEVYRARDTRLGREVAVKVLPAALASDPERLKRFEREARAASALNHPNIVTIYDIGGADAAPYIAMELVTGEPLRLVLLPGPLPVRRLLQIGVQIAEGLAKAHAAGIVHRDLKPENVMVTEDGLVKVLDFGLAKLTQPDASGTETTWATTASGQTETGAILGTVGYMSPEQAAGGSADYRSDQFSFGSILYEMATGRRAFRRASAPQTMTAIIQDEPDSIAAANPRVPAPVRWVIERCLAKEPRKRYSSTDDLAKELASLRDHLSETSGAAEAVPGAAGPLRRPRWRIPVAVSIAAAILGVLGLVAWRLQQREVTSNNPLAAARFTRLTDWEGSELDAAISSDGKFVAFLSERDGTFDAWITQIGSGEFRNLTRGQFPGLLNEETRNVGFSDDDAHVWVRVTRKSPFGALLKMDVWFIPTMGGAARAFLADGTLAVWSPDRTRIAYHKPEPGDPIFVADRNGSSPRQIFVNKPGIHNHFPTWSSDGRFLYFVRGIPTTYDMDIWKIPSNGGEPERLTRHHALVAYPSLLDPDTLIYAATTDAGSGLFVMNLRNGFTRRVSFGLEEYISIATSGDGRRLVATVANPTRNLWTVPISDHMATESEARRFDLPVVQAAAPRFGPDYLLFLSSKGTSYGLWKLKDGSAVELWRGSAGTVVAAPAIAPDGARIAFPVRSEERSRLMVMSADGMNAHPVAEALDVREAASWSPDGEWIAVSANEGDANPLLKIPVGGGTPVRLVEGVTYNPVWSPDGRLIVYSESHGGGSYLVKAVSPDGRPHPLPPDLWVRFAGNRYRFVRGGAALVLSLGQARQQNFWLLDLATGHLRQLTDLRSGFDTKSFDVSPDGRQILFDRYRENSDIVLIDLPRR